MNSNKTVFVTAGGTGGHVFPAKALANKLSLNGHEVHFLTDDRGNRYLDKNIDPFQIHTLKSGHFSTGLMGKLKSVFKILEGIRFAYALFKNNAPQLVVSFGGYATFPTLICAVLTRTPFILHEQNTILGRVNKLFHKKALRLLLSYPIKNANFNPKDIVGMPARDEFYGARENFTSFQQDNAKPFKLAVIGGSQGAAVFSEKLPKALSQLSENEREHLFITLQSPSSLIEKTKIVYNNLKIKHEIKPFFDNVSNVIFWV